MPATKIGLNLTNLDNITGPVFNFKNTTDDLLNDIPAVANQVTGGFYGVIVLTALWVWLAWKLGQDNLFGGDYGFSNIRSMGMASAICSVIGLYCLNLGYFTNYYHVVIFIVATFIFVGLTWKTQR